MRIEIEDRNADGRGRGWVGSGRGRKAVLVSQAHPGEAVAMKLDRRTRGTLQGRVAKLLEADPRRRPHACRHEFVCTGCPMLAAAVEDEAAFKQGRVAAALAAAGVEESVMRPLWRPRQPFGYRCYAKLAAAERRGRLILGSFIAGTHWVADNAGCPVLIPPLCRTLEKLPRELAGHGVRAEAPGSPGLRSVLARHSRATGEQLLTLVTSDPDHRAEQAAARALVEGSEASAESAGRWVGVQIRLDTGGGNALLAGEVVGQVGRSFVEEALEGRRYRLGPDSFFQIHPGAAEELVRRVTAAAGEGELCLEAFAGVGALTLPLAERFRRVRAVESSAAAVDDLRWAARTAGDAISGSLEVETGDARTVLERWLQEARNEGQEPVVVADPPRKGLGSALATTLAASPCRRLVLVSCDPEALARDLVYLLGGGLRVQRVEALDQFPRTGHVEVVTLLER